MILEAYPRPTNYVDLRKTALQVHHGARVRTRDWLATRGIVLHQTACVLGERDARWETVGAHFGVMRSGRVVQLHDLNKIVAHSGALNAQNVGIEFDGLMAGLIGDDSTVWDDSSTKRRETGMNVTIEQVESGHQLVRWICSETAKQGGQIRALLAHRQSSADRQNDPGEGIWKGVALPMIAELGLSDGGPGFKVSDGKAIPERWDPSKKGVRY